MASEPRDHEPITTIPLEYARPIAKEFPPAKLSNEDVINIYIRKICLMYDVEPEIIQSMVWHESRYNPNETTGNCIGLMQISTQWHMQRAKRLGVSNFYDPYGNILVGVDYFSELLRSYKDPTLALMLYSMDNRKAFAMYKQGKVSTYARVVLARAKELKHGR
jgi:soluble lytic murein transglycosylase-like protein